MMPILAWVVLSFVGLVLFLLLIGVIVIKSDAKPCSSHNWPKIKRREIKDVYIKETGKTVSIPTGRWFDTDQDEWLPCLWGKGIFRICRRCKLTEYKFEGMGNIFYNKNLEKCDINGSLIIE